MPGGWTLHCNTARGVLTFSLGLGQVIRLLGNPLPIPLPRFFPCLFFSLPHTLMILYHLLCGWAPGLERTSQLCELKAFLSLPSHQGLFNNYHNKVNNRPPVHGAPLRLPPSPIWWIGPIRQTSCPGGFQSAPAVAQAWTGGSRQKGGGTFAMACQSTHWADGVRVALAQRRPGTEAKLRATNAGHWICGHTCDKLRPEKNCLSAQALFIQFFKRLEQCFVLVKLEEVLRNRFGWSPIL